MNFNINENEGSVIIFAVLILSVILTTSLALARIFFPKVRIVTESVNSVVSAYAADSAIEWCLYTNNENTSPLPAPAMTNTATYQIYFGSSNATCQPSEEPLNHRAVGTYRAVSRSFLVQ
ncbi:MAG: hypothetical protein A3G02_03155 [Candidatus Yanofskybacteria bacterium RIFCSPLOWO2_12_FULL_44_13b]|uniref:Uncharacterized protein n=1 Tax=Candidatus Yanofskybacteria bacterium RIFCSPLOWO2_02_FULL_44_18 TaxID=1802705 RepID=A0A1F8H112_9BACT|nr:MAG: hypothetical protein A2657_00335 [Candidatus Yanofskybacteria bacterium RIFCSPHIGHO2_01_FULL_44_110b]OGN14033.1 MAG: hypothetical protein A3C01_00200 [Candidatus Yanofskybacteria bacterium RIFCSPHIGHO2_02_FULL_44_36b]OGN18362.1 MAG: hypothetical protein A3F50_00465 [Candidatus Yanofskybacteria bacterium RIFCSPHIGHO2_12_FULL_44_29b]OGN26217.1 MAG: hypothetical protein A3B12_01570 [Candidatus Yanofskybacteria bacterium RIFCSPLOWO2_01_FULL_44_88]OGN30940.1 MAG: hypothetical protein A3I96_0